jgi:catechol 2,3-dioxygenase-like lactoylglutathione lyase family enzyme|tara:strand:- start:530 stop:934 length:405 start_codon:yes stop_codon:yes gene_type:complete
MARQALTHGLDHVGLTVPDLAVSLAFFTGCLGWTEVGGNPDYPSVYLSDGQGVLTLWQARDPAPVAFDRQKNVGLHHLAFRLSSAAALQDAFTQIAAWPGVVVEFAPELAGDGPKRHCMIREPGGNRLEFSHRP